MLEETRKMYEASADTIVGWRNLSKNELCNLYIENEDNDWLKNGYFSAILLKYWNKIYMLQKSTSLTTSYEDAYEWVVDSILYALKHRRWLDKDSNVYGDPNGPDKVINRRIKCTRINSLIGANRYKRRVHINLLSLDSFEDADNFIGTYDDSSSDYIKVAITNLWNRGETLKAILLDIASSGNKFISINEDSTEYTLNVDTIVEEFLKIYDDDYITYFSSYYGFFVEDVLDRFDDILMDKVGCDLWGYGEYEVLHSKDEIRKQVIDEIENLSKDEDLRLALNGK